MSAMRSFRRLAACLSICACLDGGDLMAGTGAQPTTGGLLTIMYPSGARILAELADTTPKRAAGLMFREHPREDRGRRLVFNEPGQSTCRVKSSRWPSGI